MNPYLITEIAIVTKYTKKDSWGNYFLVAKTSDGMLYQYDKSYPLVGIAALNVELLIDTVMVTNDWTPVTKVM